MAWKKQFPAQVRFEELGTLEPFIIAEEPESLGKGKYRILLKTKKGRKYTCTTYDSTVGNILEVQGDDDVYVKATAEVVDGKTYMRFAPG